MTTAQSAVHSGSGPWTTGINSITSDDGAPLIDMIRAQPQPRSQSQSQSQPVMLVPDSAHQPPAQQGPGTNLHASDSGPHGPAVEWADAVLSSALGHISNEGLSPSLTETSSRPTTSTPSPSAPATDALSPANAHNNPPSASSTFRPPRRPSPGLAARLKALGFGSKTPSPTTPTPSASPSDIDRVGRLDQQQIRQLDEIHQQRSKGPVVERRGRPWKGFGLGLSSRPPSSSDTSPVSPGLVIDAGETEPAPSGQASPSPTFLPEIHESPPLDMDTNKYRLPDHVNGNGTKTQLETRQQHIERDTRPPSPSEPPPPPPPKDYPPPSPEPTPVPATTAAATDFKPNLSSYFTPGHQRPGSIYTLSRLSFANQLAQLTALQLPDADSLSDRVSAIPTAQAAATALINAAEQIRSWISKAAEVINGLDSEDDVEWAAAGGREGLAEVEKAILRFEELINAYVCAIEELQSREDIAQVSGADLNRAVYQMESIMEEWKRIRSSLQTVKEQVEIAMEWEELWGAVLGDIQNEMDDLVRLVFEMEERRHKSLMAAASSEGVDIGDLETIVEETPPPASRTKPQQQQQQQQQQRFSLPVFPLSPTSPGGTAMSTDDSSLLALFARMQPLRASLDFLPMRLSVFQARAEDTFPAACEELEMKQEGLDAAYKKLEKDAESLRKELGEDRWVLVFRGAGRQAHKMYESVERSMVKLREAIDAGLQLTNQPLMGKKIESYDAKKTHYGPAIERVLGIIDKGVQDRLTVNGEILRLHHEIQTKWDVLKEQIRETDSIVEDLQVGKHGGQQLRDSISSMLSNDRSTTASGHETPSSSPPSSVIMTTLGLDPSTPAAKMAKHRSPSQMANRRHSSLPTPAQGPRKANLDRLSVLATPTNVTTPPAKSPQPASTLGTRPPWRASTNKSGVDTGHNFKPLSRTSPSPYANRTPNTVRSTSSVTPTTGGRASVTGLRSPVMRSMSESPMPPSDDTPTRNNPRLSFRDRLTSPGPYSQHTIARDRALNSISSNEHRRSSFQPQRSAMTLEDSRQARPASSLASASRRSSVLPQPARASHSQSVSGRSSPYSLAGARTAIQRSGASEVKDTRPRWRF